MGTTWIKPGTVGRRVFYDPRAFSPPCQIGANIIGGWKWQRRIAVDGLSQRNTRAVHMYPGSLHYIPAYTAHRVVNTGDTELSFGACWPSDAGHNYDEIKERGFSKRLINQNGTPTLINV